MASWGAASRLAKHAVEERAQQWAGKPAEQRQRAMPGDDMRAAEARPLARARQDARCTPPPPTWHNCSARSLRTSTAPGAKALRYQARSGPSPASQQCWLQAPPHERFRSKRARAGAGR